MAKKISIQKKTRGADSLGKNIQSLRAYLKKITEQRRNRVAGWSKARVTKEKKTLARQFLEDKVDVRDLLHSQLFNNKEILILSQEKSKIRMEKRQQRMTFFIEGFKVLLRRENPKWTEDRILQEINKVLKKRH